MGYFIKNGMVCFEDRLETCDLLIEDGRIAAIGSDQSGGESHTTIDAKGLYVLPGLIDLHVHLDDEISGIPLADSYASGSAAAAQNGITTLGSFITQKRNESLLNAIDRAEKKAGGNSHCDYLWHLTPTRFDDVGWSEIQTCIDRGFKTFKFYTTYKRAGIYTGYDQLEDIFRKLKSRDVQYLIHCEDEGILDRTQEAGLDRANPYSHALSRPGEAEVEAIRRVVNIAERHGVKVHIVHVSTAGGADIIQQARERTRVTCETAPHYLFLDESRLKEEDGHRWICTPPLRDEKNAASMREKALAGLFDIYATDHAAFSIRHKDENRSDFRNVPNGVAGVGALVHLIFKLYENDMLAALMELSARLSTHPVRIAGIYPRKGTIRVGSDADLIIAGLSGKPREIRSSLADTCETFPGLKSRLDIRCVFLRGKLIVKDNRLVHPEKPEGVRLCQN